MKPVGSIAQGGLAWVIVTLLALLGACGHRMAPKPEPEIVPAPAEVEEKVAVPEETIPPGPAIMKEALTGVRTGRAAEMRAQWQRALVEFPELRDYHLYYLGIAEASAGNVDAAREQFERLLHEEADSVLAPHARLRLGLLLWKTNARAAVVHLRAVRERLPSDDAGWAKAGLLLARLENQEGRTETAWKLLGDIRRNVGPGVARRRARRAARRLAAARPAAASRPARVAEEARLLLREGAAADAKQLLLSALDAKPPARMRPGLLSLLAVAQYEEGRLEAAEETIDRLLKDQPSHALAPPGLLTLAKWRWNRDNDEIALRRFTSFLDRYPDHADVPEALHAIARIKQDAGRVDEARAAYEDLARRFPKATVSADARWRHGWLDYLQGRYDAAADSFGRLAAETSEERERERGLYWQARATEKGGGKAAGSMFASVINEFPDGYYAVWAERRLTQHALDLGLGTLPLLGFKTIIDAGIDAGKAGAAVLMRRRPVDPGASPRPLAVLAKERGMSALESKRFGRAVALMEVGLARHAERELDAIQFPGPSRSDGRLILLEAYARVGAHHSALRLSELARAHASGELDDPMDRFRYPRGYWELIVEHARARGLDPYLISALIRQESAYDPRAVSPKGARGLMQLMPKTAREMAAEIARPPVVQADLERPEVNIQLGTAYLGKLLNGYGKQIHRALAAYNAGEAAVAKWDRRFPEAEPDEFIEQISYRETQGYVKAVMRNYRVYRSLYREATAVDDTGGEAEHADG